MWTVTKLGKDNFTIFYDNLIAVNNESYKDATAQDDGWRH